MDSFDLKDNESEFIRNEQENLGEWHLLNEEKPLRPG
jgi:hypothetical protein